MMGAIDHLPSLTTPAQLPQWLSTQAPPSFAAEVSMSLPLDNSLASSSPCALWVATAQSRRTRDGRPKGSTIDGEDSQQQWAIVAVGVNEYFSCWLFRKLSHMVRFLSVLWMMLVFLGFLCAGWMQAKNQCCFDLLVHPSCIAAVLAGWIPQPRLLNLK